MAMERVKTAFDEAFDVVERNFPDMGTVELYEDAAAGSDNGAGGERQFAYCKDGNPIAIAFAPKSAGLSDAQLRGLMRHEFGHALEYRYGVGELERLLLQKLPPAVERRADAIAEAVWGDPIEYDAMCIQCIGCGGRSPRPRRLPDERTKLKPNVSPMEIEAYHGTSQRFDERKGLRESRTGGRYADLNVPSEGIWFTTDYDEAVWFAQHRPGRGKPRVIRARLRMRNPFVTDPRDYAEEGISSAPELFDVSQAKHDAMVVRRAEYPEPMPSMKLRELSSHIAVLDPSIITIIDSTEV